MEYSYSSYRSLTNDVAEQNQRKNLTEQNKALLQKVITTLRMLKNLRTQVTRLEEKQAQVIRISGNEQEKIEAPQPEIDFTQLKSGELLSYLVKIESRFGKFFALKPDSGNIFDTLPVLKPVPEPVLISRRFGVSTDPFSGKKRHHNGIDFVADSGTPVMATASGIIKRIEKNAIWGKEIIVNHGGGYTTRYAHLGEVSTNQGRRVRRGEVIGAVGVSGLSSGPHVHYEIRLNDKPVNPEEVIFPSHLFRENDRLVSK